MRFALAFLLLVPALSAQEGSWTPDEAIEEIRDLVLTKRPMSEWKVRNARIAAWLERVERDRLDLGDNSFTVAVARYFCQDYEGGARQLFDYLEAHGRLPNPDFDSIAGRLMMVQTTQAVRPGDFALAERCLPKALELYTDPSMVYASVANQAKGSDAEGATAFLNDVLASALGDERLDDDQKQALLERLYTPRKAPTPARPTTLKPFVAVDIDGNKIDVEQYHGKVLLVDFWATWCRPCLDEMPNVVRAYREYRDRGFEVVGVSLDQEPGQRRDGPIIGPAEESETTTKIRDVMRELAMTWPVVYEGGGWSTRLAKDNGIRSIPATFLLDRQGSVRYTNLRGEALAQRVAELLKEGRGAPSRARR